MKKVLVVLVGILVVGLVMAQSTGFAGDKFGMKGQIEVGGTIGFTSTTPVIKGTTGNAASEFDISPYAGYFIIDGFELGLRPIISISSPASGSSTTDLTVLLAPAYNFKLQNSQVTPFVEGLIGFGTLSNQRAPSGTGTASYSGISFGGGAGAKVLVTGNGLLNVEVAYVMSTRTPSGVNDRYGENLLEIVAGFTVFFN